MPVCWILRLFGAEDRSRSDLAGSGRLEVGGSGGFQWGRALSVIEGQTREGIPGEGVTWINVMYVWDEDGLRDEQGANALALLSGNSAGRYLVQNEVGASLQGWKLIGLDNGASHSEIWRCLLIEVEKVVP